MQKHTPHFFMILPILEETYIRRLKRSIILAGVKGVGKTHYGRKLAEELGVAFVDTDREIEQCYLEETQKTKTCCSIYEEGEERFRQLEARAIKRVTEKTQIIALGGGSLLYESNRHHLQNRGPIVVLSIPKKEWLHTHEPRPHTTEKAFDQRMDSFRKISCTWLNIKDRYIYSTLRSIVQSQIMES